MPPFRTIVDLTGQQRLVVGVVALVLATASILALPITDASGMIGGVVLGLLTVVFLVIGTLSIGTSDQIQV